ncbi:MAG: aminodeoxychorismate/anthranilate synthase component II [Chitinophagia bacterium]|nr:aminodeoxychorismate/anthranilate synthase component II [Chitinophagia bacterium]
MTGARKPDIEKGPVERILVFDNYDSFTYNLVQLVERITGRRPDVRRNDEMPLADAESYDRIILSPGPGIPEEAGLLLPLIRAYASSRPMLGVCLGHQAIGQAFGARLANLSRVYHGIATEVRLVADLEPSSCGDDWFAGLSEGITVGRYHSWVVEEDGMPDCLEVTARDAEGRVMALRHRTFDVHGVQFHPESILTPEGERMLRNWLGGGNYQIER